MEELINKLSETNLYSPSEAEITEEIWEKLLSSSEKLLNFTGEDEIKEKLINSIEKSSKFFQYIYLEAIEEIEFSKKIGLSDQFSKELFTLRNIKNWLHYLRENLDYNEFLFHEIKGFEKDIKKMIETVDFWQRVKIHLETTPLEMLSIHENLSGDVIKIFEKIFDFLENLNQRKNLPVKAKAIIKSLFEKLDYFIYIS